ncbi:MAG: sensor histidine kinase, partial [Lachnospiraceae bacterium]|nr:sensor histidine kinase [Lachnospiraceae bacterium]
TLPQDLGVFNPLKIEILRIQNGFKQAVLEEVKSQRMKTELITNVSHDLKTPLTAIITYVNLLKEENITEEERDSYIQTLEKKSDRLKVLIEDLFEVSKAESQNMTLHLEEVDLVNLIKQVRLELEDKIMTSNLSFRWNLPEEKVLCMLDGQRTYRVFENLMVNILKYSMEGSRVYIDLIQDQGHVRVLLKNMSATELNFDPEEITERFVRGDLSRNTEGSGLGLAIARSFVELQGGSFRIEIDGDLFKVEILFSVIDMVK